MKFLCVGCDAPMALVETRGPDEGSMALVYGCPACGQQTAMLTNAMETQMVRSLGVKIGGRTAPAAPMETIHASLDTSHAAEAPKPAGSKCPFTGVVEEAMAQQQAPDGLAWSAEAEARIERVPPFIRSMVRKSIEDYAREHGLAEVDASVMDAVRGKIDM